MSQDISHVLGDWEFDPLQLNVRIVTGDDQTEKIQMRIDLGLLQMNMEGKPDGRQPHGFESLLEFYRNEATECGEGYQLVGESIDLLFREGWQYYHRYLCLFHLGYFELVVRDTERNLELFQFVRLHAKKRRDKWRFDQYRPYVIMMNTRARTMISLGVEDHPEALNRIEEGRRQIEEFLSEHGKSTDDAECFELDFLTRWREELDDASPGLEGESSEDSESGEVANLRTSLQRAIDREDYEYAALLRDQIRQLDPPDSTSTG